MNPSNLCPLCGKLNPESEWACESCGAKLPHAGVRPASPQIRPAPNASAPTTWNPPGVPKFSPDRIMVRRGMDRFAAIFLACFFGAALIFVITGLSSLASNRREQSWPVVPGKILEAKISDESGTSGSKLFAPDVRYAYQVNGSQFEGHRITEIRHFTDESGAVEELSKYPAGAKVQVYYDPSNPRDSLLEPFNSSAGAGLIAMGVAAGLSGAVVGGLWFRRK